MGRLIRSSRRLPKYLEDTRRRCDPAFYTLKSELPKENVLVWRFSGFARAF